MNELPKMPEALASSERAKPTNPKIQAMRLSVVLTDLHNQAHDRSLPEEVGKQAAAAMAMTMLKHFDLIIYALRTTGGARKP